MTKVFLTVNGGSKISKAITQSKADIGVESGNKVPEDFIPEFVDYPFTKDYLGFEDHIKTVKHYRPFLAVCPDIEKSNNIDMRLKQAEKLDKYCDNVVVISKVKDLQPVDIPDKFVVGIPNQPKFGSNGCHPLWKYRNCNRVHVLGGSPSTHVNYRFLNVFSLDSSSVLPAASFGDVWENGGWVEYSDISYYDRVRLSLNNIFDSWN